MCVCVQGYEEDIDEDEELGDANEDEEFVRVITSYQENGVEYLVSFTLLFELCKFYFTF